MEQYQEDFLEFEHTDGLNYVNVEVKRFDDISRYLGIKTANFRVNLTEGIGAGVLMVGEIEVTRSPKRSNTPKAC